jgi:hypothetical protein
MFWELLIAITLLSLGGYSTWQFFQTEIMQPLSLEDLALVYKLHKKQAKCPTQRVHTLLIKNKGIVGFRCDCGYTYVQKRPRFQRINKKDSPNLPHKRHHKLSNLFETKNRLKELGLEYQKMKII